MAGSVVKLQSAKAAMNSATPGAPKLAKSSRRLSRAPRNANASAPHRTIVTNPEAPIHFSFLVAPRRRLLVMNTGAGPCKMMAETSVAKWIPRESDCVELTQRGIGARLRDNDPPHAAGFRVGTGRARRS